MNVIAEDSVLLDIHAQLPDTKIKAEFDLLLLSGTHQHISSAHASQSLYEA